MDDGKARVIIMPKDKTASHVRVLAAAREEFMEYGFEKASMRRIGERCGMTAAGLYRHCINKEDLFSELVKPYAEQIDGWIEAHVKRSMDAMDSGSADLWKESWIDMMRELVYPNMDSYRLLLTKAQGTPYESFLHDMTLKHQARMMSFFQSLREHGYALREIDEKEMHILLSAYTAAMFGPVVHGYSQEEAFRCLEALEAFFIPGWKHLLGY